MRKSTGFYVEKYLGLFFGILVGGYIYYLFVIESCLVSFLRGDKVFDILIGISTTLFGFLLAVLTLLIQGDSTTLEKMKKYGSFKRLIIFNRNIVITSAVVCFLSFVLGYCKSLILHFTYVIEILTSVTMCIFVWTIIDVFLFVVIFYKILLLDNHEEN